MASAIAAKCSKNLSATPSYAVVAVGEPERHLEHVEAELAHPGGAVGLLEDVAAGQHRRTVEGADVVQPEEAALEDVVAERVLAVHPPGEVDQQLVEGGGEELEVGAAVDAEHRERRPRLDRRVHVAEVPLVGGQLAVRVHVPLAAHEQQLVLRRGGIGVREDDAVEGEVPRRVPGVLPLVGHREDVVVVQMPPVGIAPGLPRRRRGRLGRIAVEPAGDVVVIELLAPDHAGERLAHDRGLVVGRASRAERGVVLVGLARAVGERAIEARAEVGRGALILPREPQPQLDGGTRRDGQAIPARHLRAPALGVHRRRAADDVIVDAVLRVRRLRRRPEQARGVRFVLAEEELRRCAGGIGPRREPPAAEAFLLRERGRGARRRRGSTGRANALLPRPPVAEPQRRQHVQLGGRGAGVADANPHAYVVRRRLRVVGGDLPVAAIVEDAGVGELELAVGPRPARVLRAQARVRELGLRIVVAPAQPR